MTYKTIEHTDHRHKVHTVDIDIETEWGDGESIKVINNGDIVYFTVYTVNRYFYSAAEGGCWANWVSQEYSIPFRFSEENLDLIIEAEREQYCDYAYGNIYHSTGGQECFVRVERSAGSAATTEREQYC